MGPNTAVGELCGRSSGVRVATPNSPRKLPGSDGLRFGREGHFWLPRALAPMRRPAQRETLRTMAAQSRRRAVSALSGCSWSRSAGSVGSRYFAFLKRHVEECNGLVMDLARGELHANRARLSTGNERRALRARAMVRLANTILWEQQAMASGSGAPAMLECRQGSPMRCTLTCLGAAQGCCDREA
jgi:hypothetical protein